MHDLLFENQLHLKGPNLRGYAERLQLDMAATRPNSTITSTAACSRARQSGRNSGVRGTPGFFVNRAIQDVSFGMHRLFEAVEAALHHANESRGGQFRFDSKALDGTGHTDAIHIAAARRRVQRRNDNVLAIDLEEAPQCRSRIAATEAIRAEHR